MKVKANQITLNDLFPDWTTGSGFFSVLTDNNDVPWKESISGDLLDLEYHGNRSGDKIVAPLLPKLIVNNVLPESNQKRLAELCFKRFGLNWNKLWDTLSFNYNPIENYSMTETETPSTRSRSLTPAETTETITPAGSTQTTTPAQGSTQTVTQNNYTGFNASSSSPVSDDTTVETYTNTTAGSQTIAYSGNEIRKYETDTAESETESYTDRTLTRSGNIGTLTSQEMITSERELWDWKFFDQVFADVDLMLCLPIFGCVHDSIEYEQQSYTLPVATDSRLGGIKVGENLSITSDGTLSAEGGSYDLPIASESVLGGVKVGENLSITSDGTLSADADPYELPIASINTLGGIKVGLNLAIRDDGTLDSFAEPSPYVLPVATDSRLGGIKVGGHLSITDDGVLSAEAGSSITTMTADEFSALSPKPSTGIIGIYDDTGALSPVYDMAHYIETLIPAMTSDTTPSGVVTYQSQESSNPAWKAFDQNDSTRWSPAGSQYLSWIQYEFPSSVCVNRIKIHTKNYGSVNIWNLQFLASTDGETYVNLTGDFVQTLESSDYTFYKEIDNTDYYKYYKLNMNVNNGAIMTITELQMYGRS